MMTMRGIPLLIWLLISSLAVPCLAQKSTYPHKRGDLGISAYAPPNIPHEVDNPACLDCHSSNEVGAPMIPHKELQNCIQCHVPKNDVPLFKRSDFKTVSEPKKLERPSKGAPPLIPHRIFMRENCLACHGSDSRDDIIHTTHPERSYCQQCHVSLNTEQKLFRKNMNVKDVGSR